MHESQSIAADHDCDGISWLIGGLKTIEQIMY